MSAGEVLGTVGRTRTAPRTVSAYDAGKRALDLLVAVPAVVLLLPLLAILALAVVLTSPGPALFRQVRAGRDGRPFTLLKLRSMRSDNDDAAHRRYVARMLQEDAPPDGGVAGVYKLVDPRVTPLGAVLRRWSLDELPQLLNVVTGTMSLVGPRPALPYEVELWSPEHRVRLQAKPGLTGLWQVSGRSALTMRQALELDLQYVARRGLRLDFAILLRTLPAVLRSPAR